MIEIQSDPDLPGCFGERVLPVKSGCRYIGVIYRIFCPVNRDRGNFILPVNRGSGKSGPGKSGSDCICLHRIQKYLDSITIPRGSIYTCKSSSSTRLVYSPVRFSMVGDISERSSILL
eukprot:sb/3476383/